MIRAHFTLLPCIYLAQEKIDDRLNIPSLVIIYGVSVFSVKFLAPPSLKVLFRVHTAPMPAKYKNKKGNKPRGVSNRNRGIEWIRANATDGVMYFADDDNTYDIRIFEQVSKKNHFFQHGF